MGFHYVPVAELLFGFPCIPQTLIVSSDQSSQDEGVFVQKPACQGPSVAVWHSQRIHEVISVVVYQWRENMLGTVEGRIRLRRKKENFQS